jgi:hypothetical protein
VADDEEERTPTGRMRFQDETTTPREPTLAERRAREQARRRQEEAERAAAEDRERSARKRKRVLVGAGVTVGVVAVIAVGYALAAPEEAVEAQGVDEETNIVVDDANCVTPAGNTTYSSGAGFYPIFLGVGGRQYRYNYGGSGTIGSPVTGGTSMAPKEGTTVRTSSGRVLTSGAGGVPVPSGTRAGSSGSSVGSPSGTVNRGGLGVGGSGSSSGS